MSRREWTPERLAALDDLLDQGLSDVQIARRLGGAPRAVELARKRHGLEPRCARVITGHWAAALLGFRCAKKVAKLVRRGAIRGSHGWRQGPYRVLMIDRLAIYDYLADPAWWHTWEPEWLTDADMRSWASEVRPAAARFLTTGAVARRLSVTPGAIKAYIARGELPARQWGNWLVDERDLVGFVPPCERPRTGRIHRLPKRPWTAAEQRLLLTCRANGERWGRIAERLGRTYKIGQRLLVLAAGAATARGRLIDPARDRAR